MKAKTLEQALERLEEISDALESGQLLLDDALGLFEEANVLAEFCETKLTAAEKKLQVLVKNDDGFEIKEFEE